MLRLDRGIRRNGGGGKGIARSSRAMTEREERRKMMLRGAGDDGYHFWRTLKARSEFKIAMTETPTSAKTASHMVAIPITPRSSTNPLTPRGKDDILFNDTQRTPGDADSSGNL